MTRVSYVVLSAVLAVAVAVGAGVAGAAASGPGDSVVGLGNYPGIPELSVELSGGNDVVMVTEGTSPAAYGTGTPAVSNGCLGTGFGIVDAGDPAQGFTANSRKHEYTFTFAPGTAVTAFSLTALDWGDFLPFGVSPDGVHTITLTAYNANQDVVDADSLSFTSTSAAISNRPSVEFGSLGTAGDACSATVGQPGRVPLRVEGNGIARVTFRFANKQSMDPLIALTGIAVEEADTVAPTVTLVGNAGGYGLLDAVHITCTAQDAAPSSGLATNPCVGFSISGPAWSFGPGVHVLPSPGLVASDNAGNSSAPAQAAFTVTATYADLETLTEQFSARKHEADLVNQLRQAAADAAAGKTKQKQQKLALYIQKVRADVGKAFTAAQAATLTAFAQSL